MKLLIVLAMILLIAPSIVFAQESNETVNVPKNETSIPFIGTLRGVYDFLVQVNPILLLVFGGVLVLVSKFARWVGIILIIIALIHLGLSIIR